MTEDNKKNVMKDKDPNDQKSDEIETSEKLVHMLEEMAKDDPEIQKILDEVKNIDSDISKRNIKIVSLEKSLKDKIITIITTVLLNIFLITGLSGLIIWTNAQVIDLLVFSALFSLIELLLQFSITTFFPRIKIMTFGLCDVFSSIFSFIISLLILPSVNVKNVILTILLYIIISISKVLIQYSIYKYKMEKIRKWKK